jgi:hypothetical protein
MKARIEQSHFQTRARGGITGDKGINILLKPLEKHDLSHMLIDEYVYPHVMLAIFRQCC